VFVLDVEACASALEAEALQQLVDLFLACHDVRAGGGSYNRSVQQPDDIGAPHGALRVLYQKLE
jgi:hypothetical protein